MIDFTEKYVKSLDSHPNNPKNRGCFADVAQICAPKREYSNFCGGLVTKSLKKRSKKSYYADLVTAAKKEHYEGCLDVRAFIEGAWIFQTASSIGAIRIENRKYFCSFCDIMGVDLSVHLR